MTATANSAPTTVRPPEFRPTDASNAERLVAEHREDIRYSPGVGWFVWDGRRWLRDIDGELLRRAKRSARALYPLAADIDDGKERAALLAWANASGSEARLRAAVSLASVEREVIVAPDDLDANQFLFNAANGTIDLRAGALREHRREDLLTKITSVR